MLLERKQAEQCLIASLLRQPGEDIDSAILRVARLPVGIEPGDFSDPQLSKLFGEILRRAAEEISITPRLAAQICGVHEFTLVDWMDSVDPDAVEVYAEAVIYHSERSALISAAERAVETARKKSPDEAIDEIAASIAQVSLRDDELDVASITERLERGSRFLASRQEEIRSGKRRVAFPTDGVNDLVPYLFPGNVVLLTAATKVGKSAYAQQFADWNLKRGLRGIIFHFEDTPEMMYLRRVARQMAAIEDGVPLRRMISSVLTNREWEKIRAIEGAITQWADNGKEVYCAGWTMEKVCRVWLREWLRAKAAGNGLDFVVIDYLNKATVPPQILRHFGIFGGRGRDAELVKQMAERTGVVALLVQQEGDDGKPYETRQSAQKSQAWISLQRERVAGNRLSLDGEIVVRYANIGSTGAVQAQFDPRWMIWAEVRKCYE